MENGLPNDTKTHYDVLVVGGGPAGAAAAIYAARKGLRVALLEAQPTTGHKPGESFHPGIGQLFRLLQVEEAIEAAGFLRYGGHHVTWDGTSTWQPFGHTDNTPWMGMHASRQRLESILLDKCSSMHVTLYRQCQAHQPLLTHGRITGVATSQGSINCTWLIDATGSKHWLARRLSLAIQPAGKPMTALYGYVAADNLHHEWGAFIDQHAWGWNWVARVARDRFAWTALFTAGHKPPENFLPVRLQDQRTLTKTRGANVTWRSVQACAGAGYFIAGDACLVLDPLSSDGVIRAIMSGIQAAYCIDRVVNGQRAEAQVIAHYQAWTRQLFTAKVNTLAAFYKHLS